MKEYKPQEPMITISATASEVIALGHVITQYLHQAERIPNKTREQLEMIILLRSFQGRVIARTQNQNPLATRASREVKP